MRYNVNKTTLASTLLLLLISLLLSISTADENGPRCNCDDDDEEDRFFSIENILECQRISDLLIAAAYFSIPIELLYFVSCSNVPFKWVLFEFIAFIVLCGMTHLLNAWTYGPHSFQLMLAVTVFKSLTALVSFATAITLGTLIPLLLKVKVREFMLKKKACDLDREVGLIKKQTEAGLHVRMLTQEIRKSLDRHTILHTTLVELSKTLGLMNCAVWMPSEGKTEVNLTHELKNLNSSSVYNLIKKTIPTNDPDVREIERSDRVKILDSDSALAVASGGGGGGGSVAAIRMPILRVSNFEGGAHEMVPECYAILVLVNGHDRNWSDQELEIVEAVADQVAVALLHVSILEESQLMREKLADQNQALQQAKEDAIMASGARSAFQKGMSNGLRKPMHSIIGLLSLLQDDENLSNEQQLLVDTTVKTSNVLSTLITNNGRLLFPLDIKSFPFHSTLREVACLSKCLCGYRGYDFAVEVDKSLPDRVSGDERRVFQVILHMVGNLLNGGEGGGGFLVLRVSSGGGSKGGWNEQRWGPWRSNSSSNGYAYVRVEVCVRRSGGFKAEEMLSIVPHEESMSFSACKKLVQLMHGHIWETSNPEGFDKSMALVLRFQIRRSSIITGISSSDQHGEYSSSDQHSYSILRGLKVILADASDVNRAVTRKLLEKLGCVVVCAVSSGNECVGVLISGANPVISSCEIVIVDLDLPDLDGYDVAARIRKYRSGSDWPLTVALTASGDGETRERCLRVGMNGFIEKPGSFRDFGCELKRVLMQANRLLPC
ncbi:hypothetical protein ABFS82_07G043200 [Erythranthe guttata]